MLKVLKEEKDAIPGIVHSLLMLASSFHSIQNNKFKNSGSRREEITHKFRKLVAQHFTQHKEVAYYAKSLNITPKYLSEVLQVELGKSAKAFIDEFVIMELNDVTNGPIGETSVYFFRVVCRLDFYNNATIGNYT